MTFDRRFGLALVFAIAVQTAGAFLWAGAAAARLEEVERRIEDQRSVSERLARLEVRAEETRAALDRIEQRLDRRR
jgi:alkylation response protein AidB-like acyl-CoA dehydrogenase